MSYRSTAGYQNRSLDIERSRSAQRPYQRNGGGGGAGYNQNDSYNSRSRGVWNKRDSDDNKNSIDESRDPRRYRDTRTNRRINDENHSSTNSLRKDVEAEESRSFRSPLKRNNDSRCGEESPKKRIKVPVFESKTDCQDESQLARAAIIRNRPFLNSEFGSPTRKLRSQSLCEEDRRKKCQSTPKSERKSHSTRVKELLEQNSAAIERNLSNNWADIIEELEEQTKELNTYADKVATKYELDREKLMKSLETDAETLRKRQKRINYGKVTAEYQRYLQEVPRKHRKAFHPKTPNKFRKCSRRKFDGLIKKWRKLLHVWDENPDILPDYKSSIDNDEDYENITDDFGGTSNITASNMSYNIDDYDIIDSDTDDKLIIDAN